VSVSPALEVIGLHKRFTAGAGSCSGAISVLRGVDLQVERGEAAAIVGAPGSGRSTLLLCIAGLLSVDAGIVQRFGDDSRAAAARCAGYYMTAEQLWRREPSHGPMLHLIDLRDFPALEAAAGLMGMWIPHPKVWGVVAEIDGAELASTTLPLIDRQGNSADRGLHALVSGREATTTAAKDVEPGPVGNRRRHGGLHVGTGSEVGRRGRTSHRRHRGESKQNLLHHKNPQAVCVDVLGNLSQTALKML